MNGRLKKNNKFSGFSRFSGQLFFHQRINQINGYFISLEDFVQLKFIRDLLRYTYYPTQKTENEDVSLLFFQSK